MMNVLIYGGGAVGLGIASCLLKAGVKVAILARSRSVVLLNQEGLKREGIFGEHSAAPGQFLAVASPAELTGRCYNYILVCIKSFDSADAAGRLAEHSQLLAPGGIILLFQNGWGNAEQFLPYFAGDRIYNARVITGFTLPAKNRVKITVHADAIHLGSLFGAGTAMLPPLAAAITTGGIETICVEKIGKDLWAKMLYNCALNPTGAVFEVPYGMLAEHPESRAIMERVIDEIFAVMLAAGHTTHWPDAAGYKDAFYSHMIPPTARHRSSTLQDIKAGKHTEIDALNGAIVKLGQQYKVPTPVNRILMEMVKFKERLAGG